MRSLQVQILFLDAYTIHTYIHVHHRYQSTPVRGHGGLCIGDGVDVIDDASSDATAELACANQILSIIRQTILTDILLNRPLYYH